MDQYPVEYALYVAYLVLGPITWLLYGFLMFAGHRKMLLLSKPKPLPQQPPRVNIIVPAKDEGARIRGCIDSALQQDYPDFSVIAVNDRSVDDTGGIMDAMAAENPRLRVLHIQEGSLQPGWTGKNNALFQASKIADGQWLCFVDSDVVLQPSALRETMGVVLFRKYDMISLLPRLESHSIWESTLVPLAAAAASTMYVIALNNNNQLKNTAFANGQYLMISRQAYDAIGGHETVRDRYCEDVEIANIMKRSGLRPRVAWGNDVAAVRMYSSLQQIIKGWSRIYYAARVGSPWRTLAAIVFLLACCFSAFVAIPWGIYRHVDPINIFGGWGWLGTAIAHLLIMGWFISQMYAWSGNSRWNALLFPLAGPMLLWIMIKAVIMCITKKVEWRGTSYAHKMAGQLSVPGK